MKKLFNPRAFAFAGLGVTALATTLWAQQTTEPALSTAPRDSVLRDAAPTETTPTKSEVSEPSAEAFLHDSSSTEKGSPAKPPAEYPHTYGTSEDAPDAISTSSDAFDRYWRMFANGPRDPASSPGMAGPSGSRPRQPTNQYRSGPINMPNPAVGGYAPNTYPSGTTAPQAYAHTNPSQATPYPGSVQYSVPNAVPVWPTANGQQSPPQYVPATPYSPAGYAWVPAYSATPDDPRSTQEFREAIEALRRASSGEEKDAAREKLGALVSKQLDRDLSEREKRLVEIEAKAKQLRQQLLERKESKAEIQKMLVMLIENPQGGLGLPPSWINAINNQPVMPINRP